MLANHVLVQLHHVCPGKGAELAHSRVALTGMLLEGRLVGALESACATVRLVHNFLGHGNFGIQDL